MSEEKIRRSCDVEDRENDFGRQRTYRRPPISHGWNEQQVQPDVCHHRNCSNDRKTARQHRLAENDVAECHPHKSRNQAPGQNLENVCRGRIGVPVERADQHRRKTG